MVSLVTCLPFPMSPSNVRGVCFPREWALSSRNTMRSFIWSGGVDPTLYCDTKLFQSGFIQFTRACQLKYRITVFTRHIIHECYQLIKGDSMQVTLIFMFFPGTSYFSSVVECAKQLQWYSVSRSIMCPGTSLAISLYLLLYSSWAHLRTLPSICSVKVVCLGLED